MEVIMRTARRLNKGLGTFVFLAFFSSFLAADEKTNQVGRLFAPWDTKSTPGCTLAIIKDGRIIYRRGYGMAKLEDDVAMTPDKIFDIGSVSKQFTAACIAILAREGNVSLDDDIRRYFPEIPKYGQPITIRHLLHHTSGLRDYNNLLELAGFRPESDCPNVEEAWEIICRQKSLNHVPGEKYLYTNTGYFVLGQIVEKVSGQTLNQFAQEHIFRKLGMGHTLYQDDHLQVIKDRATGYDQTQKGFRLNMSNWDETGDGNVYTSVEDLYLWDQAFSNNAMGKDLMDMLSTVGVLNNGQKIDYAFGLRIGEYEGLETVRHSGSWAGFNAAFVRFPEQRFSVVCLANLSSMEPMDFCLKVADIYLAGLLQEAPQKEKEKPIPIVLARHDLIEKVGNYRDEKSRHWAMISIKGDKLNVALGGQDFVFTPTGEATFIGFEAPGANYLEFLPAGKGRPMRIRLKVEDEEEMWLTKAAPPAGLTAAELQEYAGDYVSEELLSAMYHLIVENGNLTVKFRSLPRTPIRALAPDKFSGGDLNLDFVRGEGHRITGFKLSAYGISDIDFVRF
jgi:CubicO group peptidase (beta-lactamase class C family)